jgi:hypothetical protein
MPFAAAIDGSNFIWKWKWVAKSYIDPTHTLLVRDLVCLDTWSHVVTHQPLLYPTRSHYVL